MRSRRWIRRANAAALLAALAAGGATAQLVGRPNGTVSPYVEPRHRSALASSERSHWLQPWRAFLDTPPTARLRDAVGVHLNVEAGEADAICQRLARNGFRHVRIDLRENAVFEPIVSACGRHGLRPLLVLNAPAGAVGTGYLEAITTAAKRALHTENAANAGFDLEVGKEAGPEELRQTMAYVADPRHGLPGVTVCEGKRVDFGVRRFPEDAVSNEQRPRDAFGNPSGFERERGKWNDVFVPTYVARFPEFSLTAIEAGNLLSSEPPAWITEARLGASRDTDREQAKAVLRYLASYTNKGASRLYFAGDAPLSAPALLAVRRLVRAMPVGRITQPRALSLVEIAEDHGHRQWEGDPKTAGQRPNPHPPLRNRDVLAFFPFQAGDAKFVVPVYVMTRNLTRSDLPPERYRLTIGGVRGVGAKASLYDPLTDRSVPVRVLGATSRQIRLDVPLTDSPRLLTITETPGTAARL